LTQKNTFLYPSQKTAYTNIPGDGCKSALYSIINSTETINYSKKPCSRETGTYVVIERMK
jgi:hypothetical protein